MKIKSLYLSAVHKCHINNSNECNEVVKMRICLQQQKLLQIVCLEREKGFGLNIWIWAMKLMSFFYRQKLLLHKSFLIESFRAYLPNLIEKFYYRRKTCSETK